MAGGLRHALRVVVGITLGCALPAGATPICENLPLFAPTPETPAGGNIPFEVVFGNVLGYTPTLVDPSFGDDSFNYYLRIGGSASSYTYVWVKDTTESNNSCDTPRTISMSHSYEESYTTTSSTSVTAALTSSLGPSDIAQIGSSIETTQTITNSFTAGVTTTTSDTVTIQPCSTVTWWNLYRISTVDFFLGRQVDQVGSWKQEITTGSFTFTEYVKSTITTAKGNCTSCPDAGSTVLLFGVGLIGLGGAKRLRRRALHN